MKRIITLFFFCLAFNSIAQTTIRVRSTDNLQTIINNATAGSTLIVEAGNYGNITVNKRLNFTGPGYFLTTGTQATLGAAVLGSVTLNAGSDNTTMTGMYMEGVLEIRSSQVMITKCNISSFSLLPQNYAPFSNNTQNSIKNCFIRLGIGGGNAINTVSGNLNCVVKGNIFQNGYILISDYNSAVTGEISNNVFPSGNSFSLSNPASSIIFKNNILSSLSTNSGNLSNVSVEYNVFFSSMTGYSLSSTNKLNIASNSLFIPSTGISGTDKMYQLSTTSPAKGAGENGVDCGAFGGDEPYVLSGLPSGPIVYELSVPTQVTPPSTLNIRVRARVQN